MREPFTIFGRDLSREVAIVAELGNNHEGDELRAAEMIRQAAKTGVDAVKLQTFVPELYSSSRDPDRLERLRKFALSKEAFLRLREVATSSRVILFSTPFDLESLRFLAPLCEVIKISSGDNTFYPLLEAAANTGKPMFVSTGVATEEEIEKAKDRIEGVWKAKGHLGRLVLFHCVSSYPVPLEESNLLAIPGLARRFDVMVGYSDHTLGIDAAVLSIASGARIIEKHFTLDKNLSAFRDHQLSATPEELKELVRRAREAALYCGSGTIGVQTCEASGKTQIRRSISAVRNLKKGEVIGLHDLTWVRPGGGLDPGQEEQLVGKVLSRSIEAGAPITLDDIE